MSSDRRPWFPWYPRDFNQDEKVRCLSDDGELLYRRALDVMWQANTLQLPSNCYKLANALARGWDQKRFEKAWNEIQTPGFELFQTTKDGEFIYSSRLKKEADKIEQLSNSRKKLGKLGGLAKAKQKLSKSLANAKANSKQTLSHTDTDIKEINKEKFVYEKSVPLPKNIFLTEGMKEYVESKNFNGDIKDMFEGFTLFHKKKGTKYKDWYAAWQTWVRNANKFEPGKFKDESTASAIHKYGLPR